MGESQGSGGMAEEYAATSSWRREAALLVQEGKLTAQSKLVLQVSTNFLSDALLLLGTGKFLCEETSCCLC